MALKCLNQCITGTNGFKSGGLILFIRLLGSETTVTLKPNCRRWLATPGGWSLLRLVGGQPSIILGYCAVGAEGGLKSTDNPMALVYHQLPSSRWAQFLQPGGSGVQWEAMGVRMSAPPPVFTLPQSRVLHMPVPSWAASSLPLCLVHCYGPLPE